MDGASNSTALSPGSIAVIFWCDNTVPVPTTPVTSVLVLVHGEPSYVYPNQATPASSSPSYLQLTVQLPVGIEPGKGEYSVEARDESRGSCAD